MLVSFKFCLLIIFLVGFMEKKPLLFLVIALAIIIGISIYIFLLQKQTTVSVLPQDLERVVAGAPKSLNVYSNSFSNNSKIPAKYSYQLCGGENISPHIAIENIPMTAKSVVLVVYDPDAPRGVFYHWVVYGLKGTRVELPEGASSAGNILQGGNDYGFTGYGGPCPPAGDKPHRYVFLALALDIDSSSWSPGLDPRNVLSRIGGHVIAYGYIIGTYSR
jgi:Raf kinase inhibitor-like YbhB/YbcL family protein